MVHSPKFPWPISLPTLGPWSLVILGLLVGLLLAGSVQAVRGYPDEGAITATQRHGRFSSFPAFGLASKSADNAPIQHCVGDFNVDGRVTLADIQMVADKWRCRRGDTCYRSRYDLDYDGDIDIVDILRVATTFGAVCGRTIIVDPGGRGDYETIQEAVDAAGEGDTILVWPGVYYETVSISKNRLALVGEGEGQTIIDGQFWGIQLAGDGVLIQGFEIRNVRIAISINCASDCTISYNTLKGGQSGIEMSDSSNVVIDHNVFAGGEDSRGIYAGYSRGITITHNLIEGQSSGIKVNWGRDIWVIGNRILRNQHGALSVATSDDVFISENVIRSNGHYGVSLSSSVNNSLIEGNDISENESGGIRFTATSTGSNNNRIANNTITGNMGNGIELDGSYNLVEGNIIRGNSNGISLDYFYGDISNSRIQANVIEQNDKNGIYLPSLGSGGNWIISNTVSYNGSNGIRLLSDENHIMWNTVLENGRLPDTGRENDGYDILFQFNQWRAAKNNTVTDNTTRRVHANFAVNDIRDNVYDRPLLHSLHTSNPPDLDGEITEGEWSNHTTIPLNGFQDDDHYDEGYNEQTVRSADLYIMNDDQNLYIAVVVPDSIEFPLDSLYVAFDAGNDGEHTDGSEDRAFRGNAGYIDGHWDNDDWPPDQLSDGDMRRRHQQGKYTYELAKPLTTCDPQDIHAQGDTLKVGFRIEMLDQYGMDSYLIFRYPQDTVDHDHVHSWLEHHFQNVSGAWDKWTELTIEGLSTPSCQ